MSTSTSAAAPRAETADLVKAGTFRSLLPILDDLLQTIYQHGTSTEPPNTIEASESVAARARELKAALMGMQSAALHLPGGHLSILEIEDLIGMLGNEAEKRRAVLRTFGQTNMPTIEVLAGSGEVDGLVPVTAVPSSAPSPEPKSRR